SIKDETGCAVFSTVAPDSPLPFLCPAPRCACRGAPPTLPSFKTTKATQNYPDMRYFKTWLAFIENPGNAPSIQVTRAVLWKRVRTWKWIPDSQQDKVWPTKVQRSFSYWSSREGYRPDRPTAAPRILLQERVKPVFFADR